MTNIYYTCPFIPPEWIAAHGFQPVRLLPRSAGSDSELGIMFGCCPFARAFINESINLDSRKNNHAVIFSTACDQMRRAYDVVVQNTEAPAFLMNVPTTWQTTGAQKLYITELERLSRFLIDYGGQLPTDERLVHNIDDYEQARCRLKTAQADLAGREYLAVALEYYQTGKCDYKKQGSKSATGSIPLALVGGPLLQQDFLIYDIVEDGDGCIVLDASEIGPRCFPGPVNRRRLKNSPLMELAEAYFGHIPDAFRRPNTQLYEWLRVELSQNDIRGIIFHRYLWCDTWHGELSRLKEWTSLPVLDLDSGADDEAARSRTATRIQAFLEMLG